MPVTIDKFEYATDEAARAAWVSNRPDMYHWKCNDNLDTTAVVDAMGNKNGVSYRNTNLLSVTGKIDRALSFNGTSDYINLGTFTTHNTFFLSCWVVSKGTNKVWHMISKLTDNDTWSDFGICKDTTDSVQFSIGGEHKSFSTWSELTNGDHLMFVGVNKVLKVYKNNILIATLTYSKNFSESGTGSMAFGRAGGGSRYYFDGTLDDIRYGTFELTEADRDFIYNSGNGTESSIFGPQNYTAGIDVTSEATIKQQGDYSLKLVMPETTSLNETLIRTCSPTLNLTDQDEIKFKIRSSRTGTNLKIGFHDSGGTTTESNIAISSADTWEEKTIDISAVANANKDAIDSIILTITNADAENTIYLDEMMAYADDRELNEAMMIGDEFETNFREVSDAMTIGETFTAGYQYDVLLDEEASVAYTTNAEYVKQISPSASANFTLDSTTLITKKDFSFAVGEFIDSYKYYILAGAAETPVFIGTGQCGFAANFYLEVAPFTGDGFCGARADSNDSPIFTGNGQATLKNYIDCNMVVDSPVFEGTGYVLVGVLCTHSAVMPTFDSNATMLHNITMTQATTMPVFIGYGDAVVPETHTEEGITEFDNYILWHEHEGFVCYHRVKMPLLTGTGSVS